MRVNLTSVNIYRRKLDHLKRKIQNRMKSLSLGELGAEIKVNNQDLDSLLSSRMKIQQLIMLKR
jgi:hypothetical protein